MDYAAQQATKAPEAERTEVERTKSAEAFLCQSDYFRSFSSAPNWRQVVNACCEVVYATWAEAGVGGGGAA